MNNPSVTLSEMCCVCDAVYSVPVGAFSTASTTPARIASLDLVRAAAISGVVVAHTANSLNPWLTPEFLLVSSTGRFGVQLFFVLSGYLMASLYFGDSGTAWSARKFAARRLARIYPLYLLFALVWTLISIYLPPPEVFYYFDAAILASTLLLANDLWWKSAWGFLPGAWSISAEALHYGVTPLLRRLSTTRLAALLFASVLASTAAGGLAYMANGGAYAEEGGRFLQWVNTLAPWNTIPYFLSGVLLCQLNVEHRYQGNRYRVALVAAVALWLFVEIQVGSITAVAIIGVSAVFVLLATSRTLGWRPLQWIGRRSYGIYFTHFTVLLLLSRLLIPRLPGGDLPAWQAIPVLALCSIAVMALAGALAQALWVALESPMIKLGRR